MFLACRTAGAMATREVKSHAFALVRSPLSEGFGHMLRLLRRLATVAGNISG